MTEVEYYASTNPFRSLVFLMMDSAPIWGFFGVVGAIISFILRTEPTVFFVYGFTLGFGISLAYAVISIVYTTKYIYNE